jgi:hypothetical protein
MLHETSVSAEPAPADSPSVDPMPSLSRAVVWFALIHLAAMILLILADLLPARAH